MESRRFFFMAHHCFSKSSPWKDRLVIIHFLFVFTLKSSISEDEPPTFDTPCLRCLSITLLVSDVRSSPMSGENFPFVSTVLEFRLHWTQHQKVFVWSCGLADLQTFCSFGNSSNARGRSNGQVHRLVYPFTTVFTTCFHRIWLLVQNFPRCLRNVSETEISPSRFKMGGIYHICYSDDGSFDPAHTDIVPFRIEVRAEGVGFGLIFFDFVAAKTKLLLSMWVAGS